MAGKNYRVGMDATTLYSVNQGVEILSLTNNNFAKAMSFLVGSPILTPTNADMEKKSQLFLPMTSGMMTLEEIQRN